MFFLLFNLKSKESRYEFIPLTWFGQQKLGPQVRRVADFPRREFLFLRTWGENLAGRSWALPEKIIGG
jgi:hypothetical protein